MTNDHAIRDPILITGASGVLGWHLCRYFTARGYRVEGTYRENRPRIRGVRCYRLALDDPGEIQRHCRDSNYGAVIHSAAMTTPDECEQAPERTHLVNVSGTRRLMESLAPDVRFVCLSTDLVFDGSRGNYSEEDPTNPPNCYARSKRRAEEAVFKRSGAVIVRTAKIYGPESPFHTCFVTWMRQRFEKAEKVPLFSDQYRTPIYVGDVARALEKVLESVPSHNLYHLGGPERLSRRHFGELYARTFGFDLLLISPTTFQCSGLVTRGIDCSLNSGRFVNEFNFAPAGVSEGLIRMRANTY